VLDPVDGAVLGWTDPVDVPVLVNGRDGDDEPQPVATTQASTAAPPAITRRALGISPFPLR
jgi:hypothetical protein